MALTQISTAGVKDDAVTAGKIPANAVGSSELADNAVDSAALAADCVIGSKIADQQIATEHIADQNVTLDKLPHGTSSNDGKFLRANNGADPTFETVTGTTINNNADNRVITGSGTANTLNGESNVVIDGNSNLLLRHTTSRPIAGNTDRTIQIEATDAKASLSITRNSANTGGPFLSLGKSRASSVGGTTIVNDDDFLGTISFAGADGTDLITRGADIIAQVDGTPGADDMPGRLLFSTTSDGANSPTERMRIHSNGAVSIANTRSYYGALNVEAGVITSDSSAIDIKASGTNKKILSFGDHNSIGGELRLTNNSLVGLGTNSDHPLTFYTGTGRTERMRILSGGGITFNGDTATANALNDYEEGTWTPDWRGASALGTTSYGTYNAASYVKIGNQVTVRGHSEITGSSGGSGMWFINNLPFTVGGGDNRAYRSVGSVMIENFNLQDSENGGDILCFVERNNNDMQLRGNRDNEAASNNIKVNQDTSFEVFFTVTYPTA